MTRKFLTPIVLPNDPQAAMEAATKQYVDGKVGGTTDTVWVGPSAPSDPNTELWWDTDEPSGGGWNAAPTVVESDRPQG